MTRLTPRRVTWTLRHRVALTVTAVCLAAVLLVAGGLYVTVNRFLFTAHLQTLTSAAFALEARIEQGLAFGSVDLNRLPRGDLPADVRLRVTLGARVLAASSDFPADVPVLPPGNYRDARHLMLVRSLRGAGSAGLLTLVADARSLNEARDAYARALLLLLPLALAGAVVTGWVTAGRMLRPVRALERAARDIQESGDLTRPVPGAGDRDELERLAATLQQTFARLAATRAREQEFVRAAAHDLRGPLTALRARVALAMQRGHDADGYRRDLREVDADLARLAHLCGHLLLLARNPDTVAREVVALRDVVADSVDHVRSAHPDEWVDVFFTGSPRVLGDAVLLAQAVTNLLSNAVRHAPGARVNVHVGTGGDGAFVRVEDDGPGVPPEVLERLGEAFYRPDAARSGDGHGLGLAIVRHVAQLHGGRVTFHSAPGEGFTALVRLPALP